MVCQRVTKCRYLVVEVVLEHFFFSPENRKVWSKYHIFSFLSFPRVAPVTCGTLILNLQMSQSPTLLASLQTASSSPPASKKLLRLFWASHMPHLWTLSCEHFSFLSFFFLKKNNNYYFCLAFWWNCQLTSHLETEFAHFHHGSFAALISTTLFAGSFSEEHITL